MLLLALLLSQPAAASEKTVDDFYASLTLSLPLLDVPLFEVTGEFKVADEVSVGIIGAYGNPNGVSAFEVGAHGRYYLLGDFKAGMQLGAEVVYLRGSAAEGSVSGTGSQLTAGPFIGGKWIADVGFTVDGQAGVQYITSSVQAYDGQSSAETSASGVGPLLNLNLGWSF